MGVTGLWKLIESSGKPVPVDTLENKVLAIDISIWLHQVVKGFQDNKGGALPNAHLLGLFHRLCKLMYYRVKPVFIFDGGVPHLKRETIAKRYQSRNKLQNEADRLQDLILKSLAREKIVQQALGPAAVEILSSPSKPKQAVVEKPERDEIFKLPAIPEESDDPNASTSYHTDSTSETDDDNNLLRSYNHSLQAIDVTSKQFKNLPADVRYDILTDIKETRKQSSWGRLHELPAHSDDFSKFQMKRLLKRRQVQVSLEETEKQMEGKSLTLSELEMLLSEEGVLKASEAAKRVASNEHTRFLLVKDLKKAMETARKNETSEEASCSQEMKLESEVEAEIKDEVDENMLGEDYDADLEKALEMSLQSTAVYKDSDYECDEQVKLNEEQRQKLKSAANSLARAYMIEYGGMNDDDIKNLMQDDGEGNEVEDMQLSFNFKHNDRFIVNGEISTPHKNLKSIKDQPESNETSKKDAEVDVLYIASSSDDSDFEEVTQITSATQSKPVEIKTPPKVNLEILIDTTKEVVEEDIFADIFQNASTFDFTASQSDSFVPKLLSDSPKSASSLEPIASSSDIKGNDKAIESLKPQMVDASSSKIKSAKMILAKLKDEMEGISKITLEKLKVGCDIPMKLIDLDAIRKVDNKEADDQQKPITPNQEQKADSIAEMKNETVFSVEEPKMEASTTEEEPRKQFPGEEPKKQTTSSNDELKTDVNLDEILANVKSQSAEISKIRLENIAVESKVIEIDDSDGSDVEKIVATKKSQLIVKDEIIEIPDELDPILGLKTPTKQKTAAQSSIGNYFETKFTIKRTPEKSPEEESHTPKVKSPFFVNKSPQSGGSERKRKSPTSADGGPRKNSKASKQLFDQSDKKEAESDLRQLEADEPFDPLGAAAKILRDNKTRDELLNIASELSSDQRALEAERNRQNRMGTSITDKMNTDCMKLLRLFGIPYIVAPMEAEAQCAFLDAMKLTDGTITDDSDIWLFGGRTVYKNFFNQKKHVIEFKIENIEKLFNVDRHKLIQLAILVGSDYTTGIMGIGAVTALEILSTFPVTPIQEHETTENMSVMSSLRKFRDWVVGGKTVGPGGRTALRSKLKNVELFEGFPNINIVDAYLHPTVDDNRERFSWGDPDVETICEFAKKTFGWTRNKTDEILQPVLKRLNERKSQASIKNYFTVKSSTSGCNLKVSKRVQKAIDKMSSNYKEEVTPPAKQRARRTRKKSSGVVNSAAEGCDDAAAAGSSNSIPSGKTRKRRTKINVSDSNNETEIDAIPKKVTKKTVNIPNTKQIIPQKEKAKKEMELKKENAIEIFKKSKVAN